MGKLFGTNGVRGITNKELTPELALRLGKAIGTHFGEGKRILVGRDVRAGGDMLSRALESGLISTGIVVHDAGMLPTPVMQFWVKTAGFDGGVMVTASHNPPEFNGIKVVESDGVEAATSNEAQIEDIYFSEKFNSADWKKLGRDVVTEEGIIERYMAAVLRNVDVGCIRKRHLRVLIDGAGSVGSLVTPLIARELGCEVHEVNTRLDPLLSARLPEPNAETLKDTARMVVELGADFGVAHDGDADRAIFIDSNGKVYMGDESGALLAAWVAEKEKSGKLVVTPFSSSLVVEDYLKDFGISTKRVMVGSIVVSHTLMENGGISGFEDNGGFIYPKHQYVRDGPMAFALMAEMLAATKESSAEAFGKLPRYYMSKIKIPISKGAQIDKIVEELEKRYPEGKQDYADEDGIRMLLEDSWFIMRKSGTEPVVRISVEAKTERRRDALGKEVSDIVRKWIG